MLLFSCFGLGVGLPPGNCAVDLDAGVPLGYVRDHRSENERTNSNTDGVNDGVWLHIVLDDGVNDL